MSHEHSDSKEFKRQPTIAPVQAADANCITPEFVRIEDVRKLFGLKRGIVYRKIKDGTIKSVLLREPGNQQGVRLVYAQSVRDLLHRLMNSQKS